MTIFISYGNINFVTLKMQSDRLCGSFSRAGFFSRLIYCCPLQPWPNILSLGVTTISMGWRHQARRDLHKLYLDWLCQDRWCLDRRHQARKDLDWLCQDRLRQDRLRQDRLRQDRLCKDRICLNRLCQDRLCLNRRDLERFVRIDYVRIVDVWIDDVWIEGTQTDDTLESGMLNSKRQSRVL